jgi:hypothetical protein
MEDLIWILDTGMFQNRHVENILPTMLGLYVTSILFVWRALLVVFRRFPHGLYFRRENNSIKENVNEFTCIAVLWLSCVAPASKEGYRYT